MVSMEELVAQIQSLKDQSRELQMRLEQAEQEVIRQRGAIERSAQVIAALSPVALSQLEQTLQAMRKPVEGEQAVADVERPNKPSPFNNNKQDFVKWSREIANYMNSAMEGLNIVLDCAVVEEEVLDWKLFKESHLGQYDIELEEMNEQVYYDLIDLTEGESFDLVRSAGNGNGLEAWRMLNKRWSTGATEWERRRQQHERDRKVAKAMIASWPASPEKDHMLKPL